MFHVKHSGSESGFYNLFIEHVCPEFILHVSDSLMSAHKDFHSIKQFLRLIIPKLKRIL